MILFRIRRWLHGGLILLMAGLFTVAFVLNRNQYTTSLATVETSFQQSLDQQGGNLLQEIEKLEIRYFSMTVDAASSRIEKKKQRGSTQTIQRNNPHQPPHSNAAGSRVYAPPVFAHFIVLANRVVPACTAGLLETVPNSDADTAFAQGVRLHPTPEALPFFRIASKRKIETSGDLYRKLSAYFNLLELKADTQTVCCILTLLDLGNPTLTPSQSAFFHSMLAEQVPALEEIQITLSRRRETAEIIDQKLTRKKGTYRTVIDGQTLSVREDGLALLYSPEVQAAAPIELSHTKPDGLNQQIIPGLFASIPTHVIEQAKAKIQKQYWMGNAILALMLLLGTGLAIGLFAAAKRQRELAAMKTQFIATVSHELRTPLSLIRLHAETLHHGRIPDSKVDDYHHTILTEAERLTGIVNNVLDFSRMERGEIQINLEPTNLSEATERIVESFRYRLEKECFKLEHKIEPDVVAHADALAYSQILFNLIDNALKYSDDEKRIRIELGSSNGWNILRVSDYGIGIADQLKKKIFDEFMRSDDHKVTARRGSGIGLSVTRRLVEEMDGTIEVEDNDPMGSVFTVKLRNDNETTGG